MHVQSCPPRSLLPFSSIQELGTTWHTSSLWLRAEAERAIVTGAAL